MNPIDTSTDLIWQGYIEKNEKEHAEIKTLIAEVKQRADIGATLIPLIFRWCVFPLIVILGGIIGVDRVLQRVTMP